MDTPMCLTGHETAEEEEEEEESEEKEIVSTRSFLWEREEED